MYLANGTDPCPGRHAAAITRSPVGPRTPGPARGTGPSLAAPSPGSRPRARTSGSGRPARRGGSGRSRGGRPGRRPGEPGCAGRTARRDRPSRGRASAILAARGAPPAARDEFDAGRVRCGGSAGTSPSSSGVPASHTSPSASSAAGSAVGPLNTGSVASIPIPATPTAARRRTGGFGAQQCTTTGAPRPATRSRSRSWASWADTDRTVPQPDAVGSVPGEHRGQARLVELDEHARAGPLGDLRDVRAQPLAQTAGELADRTAVGEHPVPGVQLDRGRERPRPGGLHLHPLGPRARAGGVESVDVEAQQVQRTPVVAAGARGHPPAARHHLDREVDEQRGGTADHVGADPARGQLGQVRQERQLADDHGRGLGDVRAGQRADPGRRPGGPADGFGVRRVGQVVRPGDHQGAGHRGAGRGTGKAGGGQRRLQVGIAAPHSLAALGRQCFARAL